MTTRLAAEFQDADQARDAVIDLERRGVTDAERVELIDFADPTDEATRRTSDHHVATTMGRRATVGGLAGALPAAVVGAGVTFLFDLEPQPAAALGAAAGAALFVGAITAYWTMAARLPVTDGAMDAVDPGSGRSVQVVLHLEDPDAVATARSRLERAGGVVRLSG